MKRFFLSCFLLLIIGIQFDKVYARLDAYHYHLTENMDPEIWWHNVEGSPEIIHGKMPSYSSKEDMYVFTLEPGQESYIRLPANEKMRFIWFDTNAALSDFNASISYGRHLFCNIQLKKTPDNNDLFMEPNLDFPSIVCIKNFSSSRKINSFASFISRSDKMTNFAPYRKIVKIDAPHVQLLANHKKNELTFYKMTPHLPIFIREKIPGRLKIEIRYIYHKYAREEKQTFRLWQHFDNNSPQVNVFETKPETFQPVFFNGKYQLTGRLEKFYIELPQKTQTLFLRSDSHLLIRVLKQERPDYLFKSLNAPDRYSFDFEAKDSNTIYNVDSLIKMKQMITNSSTKVLHLEQTAMALCRNNKIRSGGLTGTMLLIDRYDLSNKYNEIRRQGKILYNNHTFYRNVLPNTKQTRSFQKYFTFFSQQLVEKENIESPLYIFDQLMQSKIKKLPAAFFNRISKGHHLIYHIPDHATPGFLRMIVPAPFKQNAFWVKRGQMAAILFETKTSNKIPDAGYRIKPEEIYMRLHHTPKNKPVLISGSSFDIPVNYVQSEVFELYLPANVNTIEVWQDQSANHDIDIALQYRDAKKFSWSASEYLSMKPFIRMDKVKNNLLNTLSFRKNNREHFYPEEKEFIQVLNPLYRFLYSRAKRFEGRVSSKFKQESALSKIPLKEKEIFKQIELFQTLNDDYAAKELLKSILVYSVKTTTRKNAFERLKSIYEQNQNNQSLISLYAYASSQYLYPKLLSKILPLLLAEGYTDIAHLLSLILEESPELNHSILTAFIRKNWDEVIFEKLKRISDIKEKKFWQIQILLKNGRYDDVHKLLSNTHSQELPENYYDHIHKGFLIKNNLLSSEKETRIDTILEWEQWQQSHPGPMGWENANELFVDYYGARTMYSPDLDLYGQAYVATSIKPITIQLIGPSELRLEIRPIHTKDQISFLDGWVRVQIKDEIDLIPIFRNTKAPNLEIVGHNNETPGQKVTQIFKVQGGLHQIRILSDQFPIIASLDIKRPLIPYTVLPLLTPEKVAHHICINCSNNLSSFFTNNTDQIIHIIASKNKSIQTISTHLVPEVSCITPDQIQQHIEQASQRLEQKRNPSIKCIPKPNLAFKLDHHGDIIAQSKPLTPYQKMLLLAFHADKENVLSKQTIYEAEKLFYLNKKKNIQGFQSLYSKIMKRTRWEKVETIISSAGVRYIEFKGWHPESPFLRKRKSLIPKLKPYDHILADDSELVLSTYLMTSKYIFINLSLVDIGFNDLVPFEAKCQIDDKIFAPIIFTQKNQKHQMIQSIEPGNHTIRFKIIQPIENQLLRINVAFSNDHAQDTLLEQDYLIKHVKRTYHIASKEEPIEFEIEGPAWLRIDTLKHGKTYCRYQAVENGFQNIQILPEKGQDEGLFRVFYKTNKKKRSKSILRTQIAQSQMPVKPFIQLNSRTAKQPTDFKDSLLISSNDGTISMTGKIVSRKNINEDDSSLHLREKFMEMASSYRYYDSHNQTYYFTNFFTRQKENGGALLGMKGEMLRLPGTIPMNLRLKGLFYMQQIDSQENDNTVWRGRIDGRISKRFHINPKLGHLSYLSAFAQILSLEGMKQHNLSYVDQDIFTAYKLDHQLGLSIGDRLTYRPFLDTQLKIGLSLTTNEDKRILAPDHIKLNTGFVQYLKPFIAEIQYGLRWYLPDQDRQNSLSRNLINATFTWEKWFINTHRFEAQLDISHEFESGNTTGSILLHYHMGKGRFYRDFMSPSGAKSFIQYLKDE